MTGSFLDNEMKFVEARLKEALRTRNKTVENAVVQLLDSGGKRLRPAFTVLGASFGEYKRSEIVPVAAAMEIVHMATLVHDDIIDDAKLRRGKETIQTKFGKDTAVYCGDFLFSRAFLLLSDIAELRLLKDIAKGVTFICDCEIMQNEQKYNINATARDYFRRIAGKTAALFSVSLSSGAFKAGCEDKLVRRLTRIGKDIGMAFQIVDDLLDFTGDQAKVGKPLLCDAAQGIYTLPVIYAYNSSYKNQVVKALDSLDTDNGQMLFDVLEKTRALEKTKKVAMKYIEKAKKDAGTLPETDGKSVIMNLIDNQLERKF